MIRGRVAIALATLAVTAAARAAPTRPAPGGRAPRAHVAMPLDGSGLAAADRLLGATGDERRMRAGVERLGTLGTVVALQRLEAVVTDAARPPGVRVAAVRALGARASHPAAEAALARVLTGAPWASDPLDHAALARGTAALALAREATPTGMRILAKALAGSGPAAEAAAEGLVGYPPPDLGALAPSAGLPSREFVALAARLGDQRAFGLLRRAVRHGSGALQAEALIALTRLGDLETVEVARLWRDRPPSAAHRAAAAAVLALTRAARDRGSAEVEALERALGSERTRVGAAATLAVAIGEPALDALLRAAARRASRAVALRALALRAFERGSGGGELAGSLEAALGSPEPATRAAGAWAAALLDPTRGVALVGSPDESVARAAARVATGAVAREAARRLAADPSRQAAAAFALALREDDAAAEVPSAALERLLDDPAAAPVAAYRLAARDEPGAEVRVRELLASPHVLVRAHAARGLGDSPRAGVVGRLEDAYATEAEPAARRALVAALATRRERARRRALSVAAALDPDTATRELARRALGSDPLLLADARGPHPAWVTVEPAAAAPDVHAIVLSAGWAWPTTLDPDGIAIVTGLPTSEFQVRLVARAERDQAPPQIRR